MPSPRSLAYVFLSVAVAACGSAEVGAPGDEPPPTDVPQVGDPIPRDGGRDAVSTDAAPDATDGGADAGGDGGATSPPLTVTPGASDRLLLRGTIVTPSVVVDGEVLVEGQTITCVAPSCATQPGAAGATRIETHGVIAPGLVDTHNHILFDVFDDSDWLPSRVYQNHDQWPNEPKYQAMLDVKQCLESASQGKPTWCPDRYAGALSLKCEMDKFGELKGLVAGTTSIVGLAGTTSACFSSLARSIDAAQNGLGQDKIQTSALFPPSRSAGDGVCANFASLRTDAYLIHVGEGTDARSLGELLRLGTVTTTPGCLYAPQTTITHGTAFGPTELAQMAAANMKLTWSPASNVALYGATTNIPAARAAGLTVALAPDWSMGGSQNLLDELRFADAWDDAHFGDVLGAKDLVEMTTSNASAAIALSGRIGTLAPGALADIMVVAKTGSDPYRSIVAARPRDVRLTMVGGKILYGDPALAPAMPATPGCEALTLCGAPKLLCVAEATTANKLGQTYAEIRAALEAAMIDVDTLTPGDGFDFAPLPPLVNCAK